MCEQLTIVMSNINTRKKHIWYMLLRPCATTAAWPPIYIYIYICRERDIEIHMIIYLSIYLSLSLYVYIYISLYIYIYIRPPWPPRSSSLSPASCAWRATYICIMTMYVLQFKHTFYMIHSYIWYMCIYINIHTEREREREKERDVYIYIYI